MSISIKTIVTLFFFTFGMTAFGQTETTQVLEETTAIEATVETTTENSEELPTITFNPTNVEDDETILQQEIGIEPLVPTLGIKFA